MIWIIGIIIVAVVLIARSSKSTTSSLSTNGMNISGLVGLLKPSSYNSQSLEVMAFGAGTLMFLFLVPGLFKSWTENIPFFLISLVVLILCFVASYYMKTWANGVAMMTVAVILGNFIWFKHKIEVKEEKEAKEIARTAYLEQEKARTKPVVVDPSFPSSGKEVIRREGKWITFDPTKNYFYHTKSVELIYEGDTTLQIHLKGIGGKVNNSDLDNMDQNTFWKMPAGHYLARASAGDTYCEWW